MKQPTQPNKKHRMCLQNYMDKKIVSLAFKIEGRIDKLGIIFSAIALILCSFTIFFI